MTEPPPGMAGLFDYTELRVLMEEAHRLGGVFALVAGKVAGSAAEQGFIIGATWLRERERAGCTVTEMSALSAPPKDEP